MSITKLRSDYSGAPREIKNKVNEIITELNSDTTSTGLLGDTVAEQTTDAGVTVTSQRTPVISGSGATVTLTKSQSGSVCLFDKADGIIYTLPAPVVGLYFDFIVTTTITSNAAKVITDAGTTFLGGTILAGLEATTPAANPGPKLFSADGSSHTYISTNGSTTGGIKGSRFRLVCVTSTLWEITGTSLCTSTISTPFA